MSTLNEQMESNDPFTTGLQILFTCLYTKLQCHMHKAKHLS